MVFGAVSDLWFVIVLTRYIADVSGDVSVPAAQLALTAALSLGAVVAIGLFAFGASLNDLLDARHDTAFSPDRPIPAGRIKTSQAVVVTVGSLLVAIVAAAAFGRSALVLAAITAAGILFYNAAGKFVPAVGLLAIGLIHANHMLIANPELGFTLPVWLIMTHAIVISAVVHRLEEKRPPLRPRAKVAVAIGYTVASIVVLQLGYWRVGWDAIWPEGVSPMGLVWPVLAVLSFVVVAVRKSSNVPPRVAAEKVRRYGAMWQSLYGASWLLALGLTTGAIWFGLFALVGFAAMTAIKEINGLGGRPVGFRA